MTATLERAALRSLPDDELAALYATSDDATMAACVAEMERRERAAKARARQREAQSGWETAAHAQYQAAEAYFSLPGQRPQPRG